MLKKLPIALLILFSAVPGFAQQVLNFKDGWPKPNGAVNCMATSGNILYIGGEFSKLSYVKPYAIPVDNVTAEPNLDFVTPNSTLTAAIPDGIGGWYIAGDFTQVGNVLRKHLARINADGSLNAWDPNVDTTIYDMKLHNGVLYIAGMFNTVGGTTRHMLAAIDTLTGQATSWNPDVSGTGSYARVSAITIQSNTLYAGGNFNMVGSVQRYYLAGIDITTGVATSWNPDPNDEVSSLASNSNTVYAGGGFTGVGGVTRSKLAAIDITTGTATSWNPNANGYVNSIELKGNKLYVAGSFNNVGGSSRNGLAAINTTTGNATSWNPTPAGGSVAKISISGNTAYVTGSFTTIGGVARYKIAAIDLTVDTATSWYPDINSTAYQAFASSTSVYITGSFTFVGGVVRQGLAAIDVTTGQPTSWNPSLTRVNSGGTLTGIAYTIAIKNGTVYVGGSFTNVGATSRTDVAAIDSATGIATTWNPSVSYSFMPLSPKSVNKIEIDGNIAYIGGTFIGKLFAVDLNTGLSTGLSTAMSMDIADFVSEIKVKNSKLYIAGRFTTAGGVGRTNVASIDASTGIATNWNPAITPQNGVYTRITDLEIFNDTIYIAGDFTAVNGTPRNTFAALDINGNLLSLVPNQNAVNALLVYDNKLYMSNQFTTTKQIGSIDLLTRVVSQYSIYSASTYFSPTNNYVVPFTSLAVIDSLLVLGGTFPYVNDDYSRKNLVAATITSSSQSNFTVTISSNPNGSVCPGQAITFSSTVTNANGFEQYSWRKNGAAISGATTANYTSSSFADGDVIDLIVTNNGQADTSSAVTIDVQDTFTWTGDAGNSLWSDTGNWSCNIVPDSSINVSIPSGTFVIVDTPNAEAANVTVDADTYIFYLGNNPTLHVYGTLTNNGTMAPCGGTLQVDN